MGKYITAMVLLALAYATSRGMGAPEEPNQQIISREFIIPGEARTFAIEYTGKISEIPENTQKLRIWMPVPQNSTVQSISELSFSEKPRLTRDPKYGNQIAYWEIERPNSNIQLTMKFVCSRDEVSVDLNQLKEEGADQKSEYLVFKQPDRLVLVDDRIRRMSEEVTAGRRTTIEKARAIYDYVVSNMMYDKNHEGWGLGSTQHACDIGKGNCTDFHALFNSLCRAQGIASGFEIGLYLPYERRKQEPLGGYHCWAFFRIPGKTWVPVDCSEADRFGERKEFFFGGHTSNRVALSTGRDIALEPPQAGERLNYFLNPYAEADGKPVKAEKVWSYRDLD